MQHLLDTSIPFLVARAGIKTGLAFTAELKQFNLTLNEWRVCATLRHQPFQRIGDVANHTSIETSTLSRLIDSMIKNGMLVREISSDDGRARALKLTEKGEEITDRVIPLAQLYERVALAGISVEHATIAKDFLIKMYNNLDLLSQRDELENRQKSPRLTSSKGKRELLK